MADPNAIEQTVSSTANAAELYISIEVEKNSRSCNTRVKATARWINWSDETHGLDYMVPLGDGRGNAGTYMPLESVLDDLMRRAEKAVADSVARQKGTEGEA